MKLLHVLPSLDPRGGGPMESVLQGGLASPPFGCEVEILTLDAPDEPFLAGYPLPVHAIGPSRGGYRYNARLVPWLRAHAARYAAVIVNGLWQYHGFGSWRALHGRDVPYFVYPHGMLDPWFKRTYPLKHLKKSLYWPWAEYRLLRDARGVLFTTEEERLLARQSFARYRAREVVVGFGTSAPPVDAARLRGVFAEAFPQLAGRRFLLYLSRLHEKKGCDLLIEAFARVAASCPELHLVMAGPDQTGLRPALQALAQAHGIAARVHWPGMLQGDLKWGAFYSSEAYVLPSHQENFGIAVAEALGCGVPVLISDKVNIWREIQADGAGLVDVDTVEGTERSLRAWLALEGAQRGTMSVRASSSFTTRFAASSMARSLIDVVRGPAQAQAGA